MNVYNVEVIAHNKMEEKLIDNTNKAIYRFVHLSDGKLLESNYNECYTRIKILQELDILTYANFYYLTDYLLIVWKVLNQRFINETISIKNRLFEDLVDYIDKQKLIYEKKSKIEVITAFMAMLELNRASRISIEQEYNFGDISLKKIKEQE